MMRDYTHVLDCCDAVVRAVDMPRLPAGAQRILNVAAGNVHTVAEVAAVVREVIPGADIELGMDLTPGEEANLRMRASLDVTMAGQVLGWAPRWSLEQGVREYADRFRRHLAAGCAAEY
ncbi:hypothetical protein LP414_07780 [Polaromonas sp. P1(28)-13]|nr:hypothetical protein LP414_07780 [Polaromonas sp. P1(28)-13]